MPFFSCSKSNSYVLNFSFLVRRQSRINWLAWTCYSDLLMAFLNLFTTAAAWLWLLTAILSFREFMYCFIWDSRTISSEFIGLYNNIVQGRKEIDKD